MKKKEQVKKRKARKTPLKTYKKGDRVQYKGDTFECTGDVNKKIEFPLFGMDFGKPENDRTSYSVPIDDKSSFTFTKGSCRTTLTGDEMLRAFDLKRQLDTVGRTLEDTEKELSALKKKFNIVDPIPDIPKEDEGDWVTDLQRSLGYNFSDNLAAKLRAIFPQKNPVGVMKKLIEFRDQYDKAIDEANKVKDQAGAPGNWNADEYLYGMYNGIELILSIFERREVKYREAPKEFIRAKIRKSEQSVNLRQRSPAELVNDFVREAKQHEDMIPTIIGDFNRILLIFMREKAEQTGEVAAINRKRFEEVLQAIREVHGPGQSPR